MIMNSRLLRLLDVTRKENKELSERVAQLEKELEDTLIINEQLSNAYAKTCGDLLHERKVNESLVKHSHILFKKLCDMEEEKKKNDNSKREKEKIAELAEKYKAMTPTIDDLEVFFKGSIANGTKD